MGTTVSIKVVTNSSKQKFAEIAASVFQKFEEIEARFSRFRENSELNQINHAQGVPFPASDEFFTVAQRACQLAEETDGAFDPTILNSLIAEGYGSDFKTLEKNQPEYQPEYQEELPTANFREIMFDDDNKIIIFPVSLAFDLGGIVKGYAVDRAADILAGEFDSFLINAGGDIRLVGQNLDGEPWRVGVEHPTKKDKLLVTLAVTDKALATSGSYKRRWKKGDSESHHIIDPTTGHSTKNELISVTVINDSVEEADSLATTIFVLGAKKGLALAKKKKVECLLATHDLKFLGTPGIEKYVV